MKISWDEYDLFTCNVNNKELNAKVDHVNGLLRAYSLEVKTSFDYTSFFWKKERQECLFYLEKANFLNKNILDCMTLAEVITQCEDKKQLYKKYSDIFIERGVGLDNYESDLWLCGFGMESDDQYIKRMNLLEQINQLKEFASSIDSKRKTENERKEYQKYLKLKEKYEK